MKFKNFFTIISLLFISIYSNAQSKVELEFKTGSDDLAHRDFQKDLEIRIKVQGKPDIVRLNANNGQTWPNNSLRKVTIPLDASIAATDIKEIVLVRTIVGNSKNNLEGAVADNWKLQTLVATATIVQNQRTLKFSLLNEKGIQNKPLFRFVYENRDGAPNEGDTKAFPVTATLVSGTGALPTITFKAVIKTGGDDLRGGGDNLNISIKYKTAIPQTTFRDVNGRRNWPNFSTNYFEKTLPTTFDINNIESIDLLHTGGGGIGADNWYLDEIKIIIVINGVENVILDKVDTPIHYFKGDSRKKVFRQLQLPKAYLK